jgi:hypothetical protein
LGTPALDDRFAVVVYVLVVYVVDVVVIDWSSGLRSSGCLVELKVRLELVLGHEACVATAANERPSRGMRQKMLKKIFNI